MSFLELFDVLNDRLVLAGEEPIAFDHDCREGICGSCSMMIDGRPHGPETGTATCQLHMRKFADGAHIGFPIVKDLAVDRSAFDRIIAAGGYITAPTGSAPDANLTLVPKDVADAAMDAAACIGCGACVAACPNSAAQLFTAAKVMHAMHGSRRWSTRWNGSSDPAPTTESAKPRARRRSPSTSSHS
jgi:succinate dehydrogenase / fumarate reductase iron-sulfur subunit